MIGMSSLLKSHHAAHIFAAWGVLMALTAASWWVGADHSVAGMSTTVAMVSLLLLTFSKIYVVGHSFMELREASPWLVRLFSGWCAGLCAVLTGMYLTLV